VPESGPESRRVENRVAGADANPYLAIAASLACGWLGVVQRLEPTEPIKGSAYRLAQTLPQQMPEGLRKLSASTPLKECLGEAFVEVLLAVKQAEHEAYQNVISSWEREYLLLNV
jgi:glutamine synthetase